MLLAGCVYMYARFAYIIHAEFTIFLIRKQPTQIVLEGTRALFASRLFDQALKVQLPSDVL